MHRSLWERGNRIDFMDGFGVKGRGTGGAGMGGDRVEEGNGEDR